MKRLVCRSRSCKISTSASYNIIIISKYLLREKIYHLSHLTRTFIGELNRLVDISGKGGGPRPFFPNSMALSENWLIGLIGALTRENLDALLRAHSHGTNVKAKNIKEQAKQIKKKFQTSKTIFDFVRCEWASTIELIFSPEKLIYAIDFQKKPSNYLYEITFRLTFRIGVTVGRSTSIAQSGSWSQCPVRLHEPNEYRFGPRLPILLGSFSSISLVIR